MKRALLVLLVIVVLVPASALAAAHFLLTQDWLKARAEEAVQRSTGRALTIAGPVRLAWSLTPTIEAQDVSLANPPGMSRPAMAHLDRVQAQVALLPLLSRRVEISRIVLTAPDVLFERDAAGHPNWVFVQPPSGSPSAAPATPNRPRMELAVGAVEVRDALIGWRAGGSPAQLHLPALDYTPATNAVHGTIQYNGVPLELKGTAGPIEGANWPLALDLVGGGIAAAARGTVSQAVVALLIPDLGAITALAGRALPDLHGIEVNATLAAMEMRDFRVVAGASDLDGVRLVRASLATAAADQPITVSADLAVGQLPIALAGTAGTLQALLGGGPIPLQGKLSVADAALSAEGSVSDLRGTGLQLALSGNAPDLARLGDKAGVAVPALHDVSVQARLAAAPPGFVIRGLHLASSAGDLAGDLAFGLTPRPAVRGTLVSQRLDLDGLALHAPPAPSPPPPPQPPPATAAPAPKPEAASRVIPDTKLPLAALRRFDADLHLTVGEAVWRGVSYRAVDTALRVADGKLRVDPLTLQGPGGPMRAQLTADADPPAVAVSAQAPGLAAGPVLALFGAPEFSPGTIDLDLQLRGLGDTPRALAATLDGHLGAALVDGEVDNRWLADLLSDALRAANLPADQAGRSHVRCAAIRADAAAGVVKLPTLTLDAAKLKLDGTGELNLANETVDLHLRPQLRLGALLAVPVHVSGAFRAPKVALDPGVLGPGRIGLTIGGPPAADTCGPALALAREGHAGPLPTPAEPAKPVRPADLLRSLLR